MQYLIFIHNTYHHPKKMFHADHDCFSNKFNDNLKYIMSPGVLHNNDREKNMNMVFLRLKGCF